MKDDFALNDESSVAIFLGRRTRGGVPASSTAGRAMRQANARGASLGTGYLGIGALVVASAQGIYGLGTFVTHFSLYPNLFPAAAAWVLYALALVSVSVYLSIRGENLPNWLFVAFLCALAAVVALDLVAIWRLHNIGEYATASVSVGFGLMAVLPLRRFREIIAAASVLALTLLVAIALSTPLNPDTIPMQLILIGLAIAPTAICVRVLRLFRRVVQLELDRILVQSTVSAPRFAVGMLASEELARLDLAAEELLDSVANGRIELPLDPKIASTAASLATELRLHLIEGRRETWLFHAITESQHLGKRVSVIDKSSLAGLLDPTQRDGLLAAVWQLVSDYNKGTPTVQITLGPVTIAAADSSTVTVPVLITTTGVARNRVDPAIWSALDKVGRFTDSTHDSSLRVQIECVVVNPADQ